MSRQVAFWKRFDARIAPFNLLRHPFYEAWTKGQLTRQDLRIYATEYWHQVSAFPTYLSALHSRLPDGEMRREVLRNLVEEEGIDSGASRPHSDLWMDFAVAMGVPRNEVEMCSVQPEMESLIAIFRTLMLEATPVAAMAALYAYESRVPEISKTKAEGLAKHYGVDGQSAQYFTLHETADVTHASVWRNLINDNLVDTPDAEEAVLMAGERAAKALWVALDGVDRQRALANYKISRD